MLAKAGIQINIFRFVYKGIPAFAGMAVAVFTG